MVAGPPPLPFDDCVFVNCAFEDAFVPMLHAILFAIHDCGYFARIAVEKTAGSEIRFAKIVRLIRESRLSIHDVSRIPKSKNELPRFNMPFECGLAVGASEYEGGNKGRGFLVMTAKPYNVQKTLSDLAGFDPVAHDNDPMIALELVRQFLDEVTPGAPIRSVDDLKARYASFTNHLPTILAKLPAARSMTMANVSRFNFVRDWIVLMTEWIAATP